MILTMKLKLLKFEFEFDKDDAKIVIPIVVSILALTYTKYSKEVLIGVLVAYYAIYFFYHKPVELLAKIIHWISFKCPKCKSRKLILQGYQTYKSDEHHAFYLCTKCKTTSILTEGGLTHE